MSGSTTSFGTMAKIVREHDWAATPLGPMEKWPQSLKTAVGICLSSRFPLWVSWGADLRIIYNDGFIPILRGKHPAALGQPVLERVFPEVAHIIGPMLRGVRAGGGATWQDDQLLVLDRGDGVLDEAYFTYSYSPIEDETGGIGGTLTVVMETTARVVGERRLRTLRDLSTRATDAGTHEDACRIVAQTLAENGHDVPFAALYVFDRERQAARRAAFVGVPDTSPLAPRTLSPRAGAEQLWDVGRAIESGNPVIVRAAAASPAWPGGPWPEPAREAMILPLTGRAEDKPRGCLVVGISPRRALDDGYRGFLQLLVGQITTILATAAASEEERRRAQELEELDRAKTQFFSNVSHELRTPLTLLLGPIEEALSDAAAALPAAHRERLDIAHRNALRLLKLVNTLLDFSRLESGRSRAAFEPVDIAGFTAELASSFRAAIEKAGLRLSVDCPPVAAEVYVDPDMWEKIILNLLSNAFKFTLRGEISVSVRLVGGRVEASVRDTGTGIPADELPKVFERFHRVRHAASRSFEGTGIGLALTRELARQHGGDVAVISEPGRGSTFTVSIPVGAGHLAPDRVGRGSKDRTTRGASLFVEEAMKWVPAHEAPVGPEGPAGASKARILLAEDNADMRDYISRLLARFWTVETCSDGAQALKAARRRLPDLVLTDVMMPNLDGFGLLRGLREDPATREVPVIILSARAGEEAKVEGLDRGADDYLIKPFAAKELVARVRAHLEISRIRAEGRQRAEDQNAELERRVEERTRELQMSIAELEAFSYSVAHDLRAPTRTVEGFARIIERSAKNLSSEDREKLGMIAQAGVKMSRIIDSLLRLSRLTRSELKPGPVDLSALARDVAEELRAADPSRHVDVRVTPGLTVFGDEAMLRLLLDNLLGNAWKFTRGAPKPRLEVGREPDGKRAFFVRDNGVGFDMRYSGKLFAAFQRLHSENEFPGTGLGLALAERIVRRHHGAIWAVSVPREGATFYFTIGQNDA